MSEREPTTCRHCGSRIVPTKFLGRDTWTHQKAGHAFQDGQHEFCHRTIAEPPLVCADPNCMIKQKSGFPTHGPHDFRAAAPSPGAATKEGGE